MFRSNRTALFLVFVGVGLLAGCSEHLDYSDTLTRGTGDAVAHNKVVQTIDPWPAAANRKRLPADGARAAVVHEKYQEKDDEPLSSAGKIKDGASQQGAGVSQ